MRRFELPSAVRSLISVTDEQLVDIRANYNMGLITFHEYSCQLLDASIIYRDKLNQLVESVMDEEGVSIDFIKGYLAHESIGC